MDNPIWLTESVRALATAVAQFPVLQLFTDVLLKSVVVLAVFWLLDRVFAHRISSASRHLLWLNALLCLAMLPWLPALISLLPDIAGAGRRDASGAIFELTVLPGQQPTAAVFNLTIGLLCIYLIPATVMLSKLFVALHLSRRLYLNADPVESPATMHLLVSLKQTLLLSRNVRLRINDAIESPVSFGLFTPTIILPAQARGWNDSITTDVLLHELCHIKRLDWLTTLFAYLVACMYWINPLTWLAIERLRSESEHSCDSAVLNTGRNDTDYAESLLGVATRCIRARPITGNSDPLMQSMLDQNTLITRISRVLEENKMQASELKKEIKLSTVLLLMLSTGMLSALSATRLLSAQELAAQEQASPPVTRSANGEMLPLHTEEAVYPKVAADGGIEGWVHLRFTVDADGSVPASSINVVDAEPADVFNNSAVNAAAKFRFSPRVVEGEAVSVENVQYVFRYRLTEEPELDSSTSAPD